MLSFLPSPIIFIINLIALSVVTFVLSLPILILAIVRFILPIKPILALVDGVNLIVFRLWVGHNAFLIWLTNKVEWDIKGNDIEKIKGSCIIISNHVSWADIVMLNHVYRGKIPITKFFLKQNLIFIPILGLVCYSIGMPFLKRYTRNQLLKNPALKTKDINSTKKACNRLLTSPSSLVNFVEGTRYTEQKAKAQKTPYNNLMPPKTTSLGVALEMIGNHIDCMLNTTMLYPGATGNIFYKLLCGRLKKFVARVEVIDSETIKNNLVGNYLDDKQFKHAFTMKLRDIWQKKDDEISEILGKSKPNKTAFNTATNSTTTQDPLDSAAASLAAGDTAGDAASNTEGDAVSNASGEVASNAVGNAASHMAGDAASHAAGDTKTAGHNSTDCKSSNIDTEAACVDINKDFNKTNTSHK